MRVCASTHGGVCMGCVCVHVLDVLGCGRVRVGLDGWVGGWHVRGRARVCARARVWAHARVYGCLYAVPPPAYPLAFRSAAADMHYKARARARACVCVCVCLC